MKAKKICCVYSIVSAIDNKQYIGSTKNVQKRFRQHKKILNMGLHVNTHLQRAYNKYGESNFTFNIVKAYETRDEAKHAEQLILNEYKNTNKWDELYNISESATGGNLGAEVNKKLAGENNGMFNYKHSEEAKNRIRESRKALLLSSGENNGMAKLTNDNVLEIRQIWDNNKEQFDNSIIQCANKLSTIYNVSIYTIRCLLLGQTWKHLL